MKKFLLIIILLISFAEVTAQTYDWQNYVEVNGIEFRVTENDDITKIGSNYYIAKGDSIEKLYFSEVSFPGKLRYYVFTLDSIGNREYIEKYVNYTPEQKAQRQALMKDSTVKRLALYPEEKPYQLYTNPETQQTIKYYDIKRTPDGRYISEREFQSYRGNFTYVKMIKGGISAMDTSIIIPPNNEMIDSVKNAYEDFYDLIGRKTPTFDGETLDGKKINSEELLGKIVVINFWFLGCPPCIREMPQLNTLEKFYSSYDELVFMGFSLDSKYRLKLFEEGGGVFRYMNVPEANLQASRFKIPVYPAHIIIDKKGIIQFVELGADDEIGKTLSNEIEKLLRE